MREIGGFSTASVTEDFLLTLALQNEGWKSVYLSEPLSEGLAPEGLKEYVTQRARWCLGLMQIARSPLGPLSSNNLRLRDRWSVVDSVLYWTTTYVFRIAAITAPLLYWYFDVVMVDARLPEVISYFGAYYFWILLTMNLLTKGILVPILHDVSQLLGAIPISRAAFTGLFKPHGHPFSVTAKGGDRSKVLVQWRMMMPFLIGFILTFGGLLLGVFFDRFATHSAGDGKWVILFWSLYNLVVLAVTCLACIERPRKELHVKDRPERAVFSIDGRQHELWITSLTMDTVRIRGLHIPPQTRGHLVIDDIPGRIETYAIAEVADGLRLQLLPTDAQREAFFVKFYADGHEPGVTEVKLRNLARDIFRSIGPRRD
ncbi:hypothetical protein GCM10007928_48660 [Sulfitobacter porphyrae]|nr:hypothetical protein GCM10007928_48660 [Sulfitobacter porphyrae]